MRIQELPALNLPRYDAPLRRGAEYDEVYDPLRRKWVALTPEEWVRQHFTAMMVHRGFSQHRLANEISLRLNGTLRRCDTIYYDNVMRPVLICEYKAPRIPVTQKTFEQAARYNLILGARYLVVSNGLHHFCCEYTGDGYKFLPDLPDPASL